MPLREYRQDLGFRRPPLQPAPTSPVAPAPSLFDLAAPLIAPVAPGIALNALRSSGGTYAAAFRLENDVLAVGDLFTRKTFEPDPNFDVVKRLQETGLWDSYRDNFLTAQSEDQFQDILGRIQREERDKQTLSAAGPAGMIPIMIAGLASPTSLIPFVTGGKFALATVKGASLGLAAGVLQEVPLQLAQETRTAGESLFSIGISAVLGGVLGGAVSYLHKPLAKVAEGMAHPNVGKVEIDMGLPAEGEAIALSPGTAPASLSAAALESAVPELKRMSLLPKALDPYWDSYIAPMLSSVGDVHIPNELQNIPLLKGLAGKRVADLSGPDFTKMWPTVFNFRSRFAQSKRMTAMLEDSGLDLENARPGGTVANRVRTYDAPLAQALQVMEGAFNRYRFGPKGSALGQARAGVQDILGQKGKLTASQFEEQIGVAMRNGDVHDIPEVAEVAAHLRKEVYDPLFDAAKKEGLFSELPAEVLGDSSYLNRVYDLDLIKMREPEFQRILVDDLVERLQTRFNEELDKLNERRTRTAEFATDVNRPADEIQALRNKFRDELKQIDAARTDEQSALEDFIGDARSARRDKSLTTAQKQALGETIKELEAQGGPELAARRAERRRIDKRLRNLNRAAATYAGKQAAKLEKIEHSEELSHNSLIALVSRGQRFLRDLEKVSDEKLDTEVSRLRDMFAKTATMYDNVEAKIKNLEQSAETEPPPEVKVSPDDPEFYAQVEPYLSRKGAEYVRGQLVKLNNLDGATVRNELDQLARMAEGKIAQVQETWKPFLKRFEDPEFERLLTLGKRSVDKADQLTSIADRLGEVEGLDRDELRALVSDGLDEAVVKTQRIVGRRAQRSARLQQQAKDLDPTIARARVSGAQSDLTAREAEFRNKWTALGADNPDAPDFREYAKDLADNITQKILGTNVRLPGMDIILDPRGPELARTLAIPSAKLKSADGRSFLVDNARELTERYVRTLAPDIELHKAFGDFAPDMGRNEEFQKLTREVTAEKERIETEMKAGRNPNSGREVSRPYTQEQIDKEVGAVDAEAKQVRRNLEALIGRIRHTWGVPTDPRSLGNRAARIASNVNVLRFMNNVLISSFPDLARPIMKYGLLRTFKDGYVPFVRSLGNPTFWKEGFTARRLRSTGAALDVLRHSRSHGLFDVFDYTSFGSPFEKGLQWATARIGQIALFDYWTAAMKQIHGSVANAYFMDSLAVVAGGEKASAKELQEATEYLARGGVDDQLAALMWRESQKPGAGELVDGQWWANTEGWNKEARDVYNQFILREVNTGIITPSVDAPLFVDRNAFLKLLFQFKSFGISSTTRTFMAGLQQRDMALVSGAMISLALGSLSYYIYANIVGGPVLDTLNKSLADGDYGKIADEAINRSGLLGLGSDVQSIMARIPGLAPYATFSDKRLSRQGSSLLESVAGPTFGDLANTAANVALGIDAPTQATVHQLRTLGPFQNHILFRHLYDEIEKAAHGLPERRQ